jgi:hypothetical protein
MPAKAPAFVLSRQVSNLNSSDPESDVLPITPRDNFAVTNIENFLLKNFLLEQMYVLFNFLTIEGNNLNKQRNPLTTKETKEYT